MLRTHTCGELRIKDINQTVTLTGWVQRTRDKGSLIWIDLRDRYGITQLFLEEGKSDPHLLEAARRLGREFVISATGTVAERQSKNDKMPTGVAVSPAMNHGGPFPSTGHPGFSAVGIPGSMRRFAMLQCFDQVSDERLPAALRNQNPNGAMWRQIDGNWTQGNL